MHTVSHILYKVINNFCLYDLGGRTPSYGYMTPSHDPSRTPSHGGSAWDPSSAATPARNTDDFDYTGNYDTPSPAGVSVLAFLVYHCQAFLSFVSDTADLLEL